MSGNCKCFVCQNGIESLEDFEKTMMEKHGWYAHLVPDPSFPLGINCHTHGLDHTFNHRDLQIIFPLNDKILIHLLHNCVDYIKENKHIPIEKELTGIIQDYHCKFVRAQECDRDVLRMIVPDKYGNLGFDMDGVFKKQYQDISYLYN